MVQKIVLPLPVSFAPFVQMAPITDILEMPTFILEKLTNLPHDLEASLGNKTSFLSEMLCL